MNEYKIGMMKEKGELFLFRSLIHLNLGHLKIVKFEPGHDLQSGYVESTLHSR